MIKPDDIMADSVSEALLLLAMFRSDYVIRTHDERIGWLMFLDAYGYPWRDEDAPIEQIDANW